MKERMKYQVSLGIFDEDKNCGTLVVYEGHDVCEMKDQIDPVILGVLKPLGATAGNFFVDLLIESKWVADGNKWSPDGNKSEEYQYYDHDEQWLFVDAENGIIKHGVYET